MYYDMWERHSPKAAYMTDETIYDADSLTQQIRENNLSLCSVLRLMTENQSLGARLRNQLTTNLAVSTVAVLLAVVALFAFGGISDIMTGGVLLALNIAVFIPYAYERYWPVAYSTGAAAVWTISAALITTGLFIGVFQLVLSVLSNDLAPPIAFIITVSVQYGIAALFARIRQSA